MDFFRTAALTTVPAVIRITGSYESPRYCYTLSFL